MTVANSIGSGQTLSITSSPTFSSLTLGGTFINSLQPLFFAYANANITNVTGDGTTYTIAFNTEYIDQAGNFASNTFTAPTTGKYLFSLDIKLSNFAVGHTVGYASVVIAGTSAATQQFWNVNPANVRDANNNLHFSGSVGPITLTAGDTVIAQVTVSNSTKTVTLKGAALSGEQSSFAGYLVC
jgi:hypothetical protein